MIPAETDDALRKVHESVESAVEVGASPLGILSRVVAALDGLDARQMHPPETRERTGRVVDAYQGQTTPANVYRIDRPRTRGTDPETSAAAAEQVRSGLRRPGGKVHRILRAYVDVTATTYARHAHPHGMTAREVEFVANVKAAHKRTSELLADGLLRVVTSPEGSDLVRKGGRVLAITDDGRAELARMDRAIAVRDEKRRARDQRRRVRETGRA